MADWENAPTVEDVPAWAKAPIVEAASNGAPQAQQQGPATWMGTAVSAIPRFGGNLADLIWTGAVNSAKLEQQSFGMPSEQAAQTFDQVPRQPVTHAMESMGMPPESSMSGPQKMLTAGIQGLIPIGGEFSAAKALASAGLSAFGEGAGQVADQISPKSAVPGFLARLLSPSAVVGAGAAGKRALMGANAGETLRKAGGENIPEWLAAASKVPSTPGYNRTLAETAAVGGASPEALAKIAGLEADAAKAGSQPAATAYQSLSERGSALRDQLDRIEAELSSRVAAGQPTSDLVKIKTDIENSLEHEFGMDVGRSVRGRTQLANTSDALAKAIPETRPEASGESIRASAQGQKTTAQTHFKGLYDAALAAAGDTKIPHPELIKYSKDVVDSIKSYVDPSSPLFRKLSALETGGTNERTVLRGLDKVVIPAKPKALDLTLAESHEVRKAAGQAQRALIDAGDGGKANELGNLVGAIDKDVAASGISQEAKTLYTSAGKEYAETYVPRFKGPEQRKLLGTKSSRPSMRGSDVVRTFLASPESTDELLATLGTSKEGKQALFRGVREAFRSSVVDPATGSVKAGAAARFLEDHKSQLDKLESAGIKVKGEFNAMQLHAEALDYDLKAMNVPSSVETHLPRNGTPDSILKTMIEDPKAMYEGFRRMSPEGRKAFADHAIGQPYKMLSDGNADGALKYLEQNGKAIETALERVGRSPEELRDLRAAAERQLEVGGAKLPSPDSYSRVGVTLPKNLTQTELTDLSRLAADADRMRRVHAAGVAGQVDPSSSEIVKMSHQIARFLREKIGSKEATKLAEAMYKDPQKALDLMRRRSVSGVLIPSTVVGAVGGARGR